MDTNQQAILHHINKGATLRLSSPTVAYVLYDNQRYIPVNAAAAGELIDSGTLREVEHGSFIKGNSANI